MTTDTLARVIATKATSRVDAFFAGHTHQAERCNVTDPSGKPRPLMQGLSFGTDLTGGPIDIDALTAYLTAHPNLSPPPADRITIIT